MTCDRCGNEPVKDEDGEYLFGYINGLCIVCDDYLREKGELRQFKSDESVHSEQQTL